MDAAHEEGFVIRSLLWELVCPETQRLLMGLLGYDEKEASRFCLDYFDRFYVLHKIGHIILHKFDPNHQQTAANTEFLANLFALKYLQYKREDALLVDLVARVEGILAAHHAVFAFDIPKMDRLFPQYRKDLRTYAAFHFNSLLEGLSFVDEFPAVLDRISQHHLTSLNHAIVLRHGTHGRQLINECLQTVFETNTDVPSVTLQYCDSLQLDNLDLVVT